MANKYTTEERTFLVSSYLSGNSLRKTGEDFTVKYAGRPRPSPTAISNLVKKFKQDGTVRDKHRSGRPKTTPEAVAAVLARVNASPMDSGCRKVAAEAGLSRMTVWRILKEHKYFPYKMEVHAETKATDWPQRLEFSAWCLQKLNEDPTFFTNVMFSDECLFYLNGLCNRQNSRYWSDQNPHWHRSCKALNTPRVMVWCGLWGNDVIGPYFFDATVTAQAYVEMLQNFLTPYLDDVPLIRIRGLWFQQDGASAHFALVVREWLHATFPNQWIGRGGVISWPPRSPDLTPLDFYFWGHVKSIVYAEPYPQDMNELKAKITHAIQTLISPAILERVRRNFERRIDLCVVNNGGLFEHVM